MPMALILLAILLGGTIIFGVLGTFIAWVGYLWASKDRK